MAKGGKPEKDKRSYMDMDDEISRQHITKKQATELALGFVPGVGVANAFGKGIAVNDSGIPTGVEDVPSTLELARTGHPWLAGLSAVGAIPDAAYLAQSAKMLSPSARALAKAGLTGNYAGVPAERGAASRLRDAAMGPGDRYVYHTSPGKIASINSSGLFDDGLHFSNKPYSMTAAKNPTTYKMKINDADYISAQQIPYHNDYSKIDNVVKEIANRYNVSDDVALDLISENKSIYDIDGIENYGDASWDIQRAGLNAAKRLGYKGLIGNDEQGATYLTSMAGREKDLIDISHIPGRIIEDAPYDRLKRKFKGSK